jgi:hypothetical protein
MRVFLFLRPFISIVALFFLFREIEPYSVLFIGSSVLFWKLSTFPLMPFNSIKFLGSVILSFIVVAFIFLFMPLVAYMFGWPFLIILSYPVAFVLDYFSNLTFFSRKSTLMGVIASIVSGFLSVISIPFFANYGPTTGDHITVLIPIFLIHGSFLNVFYFLQQKKASL